MMAVRGVVVGVRGLGVISCQGEAGRGPGPLMVWEWEGGTLFREEFGPAG